MLYFPFQPHLAEYQRKQNEKPGVTAFVKDSLSPEPDSKRLKRKDSVEPLTDIKYQLPELPEDLKKRQEEIDASAGFSRVPTPPTKPSGRAKSDHSPHPARYNTATQPKNNNTLDEIIDSGLSDPVAILHLVRSHPNVGFLYMTTAVDRSSINYNPYNIK